MPMITPGTVKNSMISMAVFIWSVSRVSCPVWDLQRWPWWISLPWSTLCPLSQCPYAHGYRYHVIGDYDIFHYHTNMPRYTAMPTTQAQKIKLLRILVYTRKIGCISGQSYILFSCDCDAFANNQKEERNGFFLTWIDGTGAVDISGGSDMGGA